VRGRHAKGPASAVAENEARGLRSGTEALSREHPEDQDYVSFDIEIESWTRFFLIQTLLSLGAISNGRPALSTPAASMIRA
jgi:hypothetical protein